MKNETTGFYLWNYGTRPDALPKEESERLLREYHKYGDKETREKLIYGHLGLVQDLIYKYYKNYVAFEDQINPSFEDLLELGTEVLISCIDKFDPDEFNFLFSTFYTHKLQSKISNTFGRQHSIRTKKSLDALLKDKSGDDSNIKKGDKIPSTMREFDVLHDRLELQYIQKEILPLLSKRERALFVANVIHHKTTIELGEEFETSQPQVSRELIAIRQKVLNLYLEGPTPLDKQLKGIKMDEQYVLLLQENAKLFEKYGREFLRQYFLPTLTPIQQKVFEASVLNYRGQTSVELAESLGLAYSQDVTRIRKSALKKLERNVEKLKQMQAEGKLPKPWKPTLKQTQEINRNEKYIEQFGGRLFLQRYFVPSLSPLQKRVFECGVLEFEGQSKTELAQKAGLSLSNFSASLKAIKEKLALTNFEALVDLIDTQFRMRNAGVSIEQQIDLDQVEKRKLVVEKFGGKDKLRKYFLPILPEKQKQVFDLLYIKQAFSTLSGAAEYLHMPTSNVLAMEKICLTKLESTNLEELEKLDAMAENYIRSQLQTQLSSSRNSSRKEVLKTYGGVAFLREKFLPQLITNADRKLFEGVFLEGQPIRNFIRLFSNERQKASRSYFNQVTDEGMLNRIRLRITKEILPQLETFKAGFEDFDQAVKDFYVRRGFEQIHPEDFEKLSFEEIKDATSLSQKKNKAPFIPPELVEKAGGEKIVLRKFRPTLSLSYQMIFMKAYVDKMTDKQIADDMQLSLPNVGYAKAAIVQKLEAFAEAQTSKNTTPKHK